MENRFDVIKLKIMRTANGYYIEHEADKVINSYSVTCKADEWDCLNPALAGSFETPFTAKPVNAAEDHTAARETIADLTAKIAALEAANAALSEKAATLTALQEAAGELDIMQVIEQAKAAAEEAAPEASNPELPLSDSKAAEPAGEMSLADKSEKETGKGNKGSSSSKKNK